VHSSVKLRSYSHVAKKDIHKKWESVNNLSTTY